MRCAYQKPTPLWVPKSLWGEWHFSFPAPGPVLHALREPEARGRPAQPLWNVTEEKSRVRLWVLPCRQRHRPQNHASSPGLEGSLPRRPWAGLESSLHFTSMNNPPVWEAYGWCVPYLDHPHQGSPLPPQPPCFPISPTEAEARSWAPPQSRVATVST